MNMNPLGLLTAPKGLHNLSPDRTNSSQLGNLHKEVGPHREDKHYLLGSFICRHASFHHGPHIISGYRKTIRDFLHIIGTATAENITANQAGFHLWSILLTPSSGSIGLIIKAGEILYILPLFHQLNNRISSHNTL